MLDVRAKLTENEEELVKKHRLGKTIVYSSEAADANVAKLRAGQVSAMGSMFMDRLTKRSWSMNDLINGQHIECKDLDDVLGTEAQVRQACENIRGYLQTAQAFDGSEEVVEFEPA